ncbi:pheromone A receptor-domain-containing protein [Butyriboletus roseoflavus]|nr:pheromone A receptor-domain-containing protein [Butyriboletus roseoflavus]
MHGIANILFIVCAGLGALLVAIPLPKALGEWFTHAVCCDTPGLTKRTASGNVGTSMLIIWTEVACLVQGANAIRWNGNIENWCPRELRLIKAAIFSVAADVALVATGVSINRRLYMIVTLDPGRHEVSSQLLLIRRHSLLTCRLESFRFQYSSRHRYLSGDSLGDRCSAYVFPGVLSFFACSLFIAEYVVQRYRFYIFEDIGCVSGVDTVNLAFPLVWMLPLFVGTISAIYAYLTIRTNLRRSHLLTGEPGVIATWNRRLMALGVVSAMYGLVPTTISIALLATAYPVMPWPGWEAIHSTIDVIVYVPAREWEPNSTLAVSVELRRWTTATLAFVVFAFLGLTADVKRMYRMSLRGVMKQTFSADQTRRDLVYFDLDFRTHRGLTTSSRSVLEENTVGELGLGDHKGNETVPGSSCNPSPTRS